MTRIKYTFLILIVFLQFYGCKQREIEIVEYTYSDSIHPFGPSYSNEYKIKSVIKFNLLKSTSNDPIEQKIVKSINNSILDLIAPDFKNSPSDSIAKYLVESNISEMSSLASERERLLRSGDLSETPLSYDDPNSLSEFTMSLITDCKYGLGDSIICYSGSTLTYTGGAHPGDYVFAQSYSLNNGSKIRLNSLFDQKSKSELCRRITNKLICRENVKNEDELKGLGINDIFVSDNFLLGKDTMTFRYDACTIAPYVYGPIDIYFLYDEISDLSPYLREK